MGKANPFRDFWWSFFWRYLVYMELGFGLIGTVSGFFRSFLHDPTIHNLLLEHNVISDGLQGTVYAAASSIALRQALKLHVPLFFTRTTTN